MQKTKHAKQRWDYPQECKGKKVLLIDPDSKNHQLHKHYFKKLRIKLTCTKSLRHGLWLTQEEKPNLILTEIYFQGFVEYEHLFLLRKEHYMPIIVQTCLADSHYEHLCHACGSDAYFIKPLLWETYVNTIYNFLLNTGD